MALVRLGASLRMLGINHCIRHLIISFHTPSSIATDSYNFLVDCSSKSFASVCHAFAFVVSVRIRSQGSDNMGSIS